MVKCRAVGVGEYFLGNFIENYRMRKATAADKGLVIAILSKSFEKNKSTNHAIIQDNKKKKRLEYLIGYCFEVAYSWGDVFIGDEGDSCCLLVYPNKKKPIFSSLFLDLKLIFKSVGLRNIGKLLEKERQVRKAHPVGPFCNLWFIGVIPTKQGKGLGGKLLKEVLAYVDKKNNLPIFLETSTDRNIAFYKKHGFSLEKIINIPYPLHVFSRE